MTAGGSCIVDRAKNGLHILRIVADTKEIGD
jgi:hypothetical protein